MYSKKVKVAVCSTLIDMLDNNIIRGYGAEPFSGWTEDGEIFSRMEEMKFTEEELKQCIKLSNELQECIDKISFTLEQNNPNDILFQ